MSVSIAHNVVKGLELSPREKKELAKLLIADEKPEKASELEWAKNDFKQRLKKIAERNG